MSAAKTYYNPINGEYTKILKSSADTAGAYSHLEVLLKPGGGNPLHYHTRFTEHFFAVKGTLGLQYEKDIVYLQPGEDTFVPVGTVHRFFNDTQEDIIFRIILREGQPGFENFIKVLFGLVNDGKVYRGQMPKNPFYAALLLRWGDTHIVSPVFKILTPFARLGYTIAIGLKLDKKLLKKY